MTLRDRARKEAKSSGKKINKEVIKGLRAIENMHAMCASSAGSPYRIFLAQKGR
jgi:hypothetical protein